MDTRRRWARFWTAKIGDHARYDGRAVPSQVPAGWQAQLGCGTLQINAVFQCIADILSGAKPPGSLRGTIASARTTGGTPRRELNVHGQPYRYSSLLGCLAVSPWRLDGVITLCFVQLFLCGAEAAGDAREVHFFRRPDACGFCDGG